MTLGPFEELLADRYRFEAELGRGAMGTVYRAMDLRLGRAVAIKVLDPMITNDLTIARFTSEISIAAGFRHPNIIAIHDSGEANGHLYYVMDYLGGETLRTKLEREKQLSIEDALKITKDVAEGLQYAHDRGVVHRDIKPENILLAEGRACILDFGLAIAMSKVETDRLTARGLSVGTPSYMSPEQAAGERVIGPAADQYSLGCVLYEMLVGEPPFTGPTATSIAMRHMTETPVPPRVRRLSTPQYINATILRALEKVPADRFDSVQALARAQSHRSIDSRRNELSHNKKLLWLSGSVIISVVASVVTLRTGAGQRIRRWTTDAELDTNRYVVVAVPNGRVPVVGNASIEALRKAIMRWTGVTVADENELTLPAKARAESPMSAVLWSARAAGAGRLVVVDAQTDSRNSVKSSLFDVETGRVLRTISEVVPSNVPADSFFAHVAYSLLFDGSEARGYERSTIGTRNRRAFEEYLRGSAALRTWRLVQADSAFSAALQYDQDFPQALLWLAQVRVWQRDNAIEVDGLISRARDHLNLLTASERVHQAAFEDLRARKFSDACTGYRSLIQNDSLSFVGWLGLGECSVADEGVIRDRANRSGWRFRGSAQAGQAAIQRAFELLSSVDECCADRASELFRRRLYTSTVAIRVGRGVDGDTAHYGAYPEIRADTLAFVPVSMSAVNLGPPATHQLAVELQRNTLLMAARRRASRFRDDPNALEELSDAMDLVGTSSALDTLRRARQLTKDSAQALRLAVKDVWLRVKRAVPGNPSELQAVRITADSILLNGTARSAQTAALLAGVAALVGDASKAATLSAYSDLTGTKVLGAPDSTPSTSAFLAYAALGGPVDSLRTLELRATNEINNTVTPQRRDLVLQMWVARAAALAFPAYRADAFNKLQTSEPVFLAEASYLRGDIRAVRSILRERAIARRPIRPADLTIDALYPQAWLWAAIGDTAQALATIVPTLDAIGSIPVSQLSIVTRAGSLMQAISLRAVLAARQRDLVTARTWAAAVAALTNPAFLGASRVRADARALVP